MTRSAAGSALLTALAFGAGAFACPAGADDRVGGTFVVSPAGQSPSTWTVDAAACTPACVARVRSSQGWVAYARLENGRWALSVYLGDWDKSSYAPDPVDCPPGAPGAPLSQNWSWDIDTLKGSVDTVRGNQCGRPTTVEHTTVTFTTVD
jgi:hypothetical protein